MSVRAELAAHRCPADGAEYASAHHDDTDVFAGAVAHETLQKRPDLCSAYLFARREKLPGIPRHCDALTSHPVARLHHHGIAAQCVCDHIVPAAALGELRRRYASGLKCSCGRKLVANHPDRIRTRRARNASGLQTTDRIERDVVGEASAAKNGDIGPLGPLLRVAQLTGIEPPRARTRLRGRRLEARSARRVWGAAKEGDER